MTTQELHIELDILLQKVNSNWNKNLLSQEKDLFLNNEILRFIKQRTSPSSNRKQEIIFETVKRTEDLNDLIKTIVRPVYYDNVKKEVSMILPFNYLSYISSGIGVCCNCKKEELIQDTVYTIDFSPLENISSNYVIDLLTDTQTISLFDSTVLPSNYLPQDDIPIYKKAFIIKNAIEIKAKQALANTEIEILVNDNTNVITISSPEEISLRVLSNGNVNFITSTTNDYFKYEIETELQAEVRLLDEEIKYKARRSVLSGSRPSSVVSYLRNKRLHLDAPVGAILGFCELVYICKPTKIDLLLNINSELDDTILKEVVANAAQTIKGVLASDTLEKYISQNTLIE